MTSLTAMAGLLRHARKTAASNDLPEALSCLRFRVTRIASSNRNDLGGRVETPQIIRIACDDGVSSLFGKDHY